MDPAFLMFAFAAGAAAFFAPCSAAMIPAYVAFAVRPGAYAQPPPRRRAWPAARALVVGGAIPLAVSVIALIVRGFGGVYVLPVWLWRILPTFELAVPLLLIGAGCILLGLLLSGRGALAARGMLFALLATAGAFTTLLLIGLPIALLAEAVASYLWWGSAAVGALLVLLGAAVLAGGSLPVRLPSLTAHFHGPSGYFKFGLAYGIAGLTCTFPAFLAIMAAASVAGGATGALSVFLAYATGKGVVLIALTTTVVAGGTGLSAVVGRHSGWITRASGVLLVLAGAYMVYYFAWLTSPGRATA